jgi:hypothetical protein
MMKAKLRLLPLWLKLAAALLVLLTAVPSRAQTAPTDNFPPDTAAPAKSSPGQAAPTQAAPAKAPAEAAPAPADRAVAYYHLALASTYEDEAIETRLSAVE